MAEATVDLKPGIQIKDHRTRSNGRVIKLDTRINPAGLDIQPYWQVVNVETGRKTIIREDRLVGNRWEQLN